MKTLFILSLLLGCFSLQAFDISVDPTTVELETALPKTPSPPMGPIPADLI